MSEPTGQISSGIDALMEKYMAVSNNIANASTAGFKRTVSSFSSTLDSILANQDNETPLAGEIHSLQTVDFSQGQILRTDRPLDIALEGKGFLYHSWAESYIGGRWVSVDPTYNQLPADPTHLKLLEGHLPEDMAPIIAIIGRIRMNVLETAY